MLYKNFEIIVKQAHGHTKWAKILWTALNDKTIELTKDNIPCWAWCMLTFQLPVIIDNYIKAEKELSDFP